ncbi:MAG TPA: zf-HC2 domain-containing protein [Vicinamibacterales bacterium]|nr:zf-HC2 domain-containing protein [Vicinamibacterales bacterium]
MTCDKDLLVGYVYDDITPADRSRFERHLAECADCRDDVDGMRGTRQLLTAWAPPQPDLGFRVVDSRSRPAWRAWWTPALGLAAAAVLVLAAAAAVANVRVTYGGVTVQTGWRTSAAAPAISAAPQPVDAARVDASYADIERRIRQLEEARASAPAAIAVSSPSRANRPTDDELLRRVRALLSQSESRQQQELALRVAQLVRDFDLQRQADLARIQQGLGRVESLTNAEAASHRQAMDILYRVAQQK